LQQILTNLSDPAAKLDVTKLLYNILGDDQLFDSLDSLNADNGTNLERKMAIESRIKDFLTAYENKSS
jgi:hypothetical protein